LVWAQSPEERVDVFNRVVPRFSRVGIICVGLLITTGVLLTVRQLPDLSAFLTTDYGRTLGIKLLLLLPLLLLAAANLLYIRPRLGRLARHAGRPLELARRLTGRFRQLVRWETGVAVVILVVAAILTSLAPASSSAGGKPLLFQDQAGPYQVKLTVSPGQVGVNNFAVDVQTGNGMAVTDLHSITLIFSFLEQDLGDSFLEIREGTNGHYTASGSNLSVVGPWQVEVQVQPVGEEPLSTAFRLDVPDTTGAVERGAKNVRNPIPPTQDSIERGRALFQTNCVACHGQSGRGDGPAAATLLVKPADLTEHAQLHPDADLFEWISNGKNQAMPAFSGKLSENERWHIINFIRRGLTKQ
jgi:mono/diheme cytochrome c family protein